MLRIWFAPVLLRRCANTDRLEPAQVGRYEQDFGFASESSTPPQGSMAGKPLSNQNHTANMSKGQGLSAELVVERVKMIGRSCKEFLVHSDNIGRWSRVDANGQIVDIQFFDINSDFESVGL